MNNKPRIGWLSGILTILEIGLGHIYAGYAKRGITLYFGQYVILAACLLIIYLFTSLTSLCTLIILIVGYWGFCLMDAVKCSRRNGFGYALKRYNRWYVYLSIYLITNLMVNSVISTSIKEYIIQAYKIPADSQRPALLTGDQILAKKRLALISGINKGDLVIFLTPTEPQKDLIKRVIAVGGETIEIRNKKVFLNCTLLDEPYAIHVHPEMDPKRDNLEAIRIPEDSLFVMGDNRDNSYDSRFFGFIKTSDVKGKAAIIYWSWDKAKFRVRWERIGKIIK